jgi:glutamyl/glutaminyl-tRNA synthetase
VCNIKGEKLSKRDFGFSLTDLRNGGFLAPAIINYLATIGFSLKEEIQSLDDLIKIMDLTHVHASSTVKYDLEKLTWFNHKWMERIELQDLAKQALPFVEKEFPATKELPHDVFIKLIGAVRSDLKTLTDAPKLLAFYFTQPNVSRDGLEKELGKEKTDLVLHIIKTAIVPSSSNDLYISHLKEQGIAQGLKAKEILGSLRYVLTGSFQGMGLHDLFTVLGTVECEARIGVVANW